jgi:hypothetical protein
MTTAGGSSSGKSAGRGDARGGMDAMTRIN